jgi:GMP synthase-like glutamine amidotransferase
MKIGILETGAPPAALQPRFGRYPDMMRRMLGAEHAYQTFDVAAAAPPAVEACEAYVITGSSAAVYENHAWIAPMESFLRAARGRVPLIGICFGHQLMAQTFGGRVIKSPKGWGIGLATYRFVERQPWMDAGEAFAIPASHQDQVVDPPPGASVTAASDFTPFAGLAYGDDAVSFQGHPEFEPAFAQALIEARRGSVYADDVADRAIASLTAPNDGARVGDWLRGYLAGRDPELAPEPKALETAGIKASGRPAREIKP